MIAFLQRWRVALASGVVLATVFGVIEGFSIFYSSFVVELGLDRSQASGMFAAYLIASTAMGPFAGRIVGRYGAHRIITALLPVFAVGVAAGSLPTVLWQFYLLYTLVLAPLTTLLVVSSQVLITGGYQEGRGRATGIAYACLGLGNFALFSILALVIQEFGWRVGYVAAGALAGIGAVGFHYLHRSARGAEVASSGSPTSAGPERTAAPVAAGLFRRPAFWLVCLAALTASVTDFFIFQNVVPFLTSEGHGLAVSGLLLGLTGLSYSVGHLLGGVLSDRTSREFAAVCGAVVFLAGLGLLWTLPPAPLLVVAIMLLGASVGVIIGVRIATVGDLFSGVWLARAVGFFQVASAVGAAFGAWFGGFSFSTTGGYGLSFVVVAACAVIWVLVIWSAAPRRGGTDTSTTSGVSHPAPHPPPGPG